MTKAAFLDRDGTINVEKGYVHKVEDFEFIPGIFDLCRLFDAHHFKIVIISNQSGIGRGYYTVDQLDTLTAWMIDRFEDRGIPISKFYFCPHHPTEAIGRFKTACDCRKPKAGMIFRAQKELGLNLAESLIVGDQPSDILAGCNAGIGRKYLIGSKDRFEGDLIDGDLFENLFALTHFFNQLKP